MVQMVTYLINQDLLKQRSFRLKRWPASLYSLWLAMYSLEIEVFEVGVSALKNRKK